MGCSVPLCRSFIQLFAQSFPTEDYFFRYSKATEPVHPRSVPFPEKARIHQ